MRYEQGHHQIFFAARTGTQAHISIECPGRDIGMRKDERLRRQSCLKENIIGAKLFVGNLNFDTTKEELEAVFSEVGQIVDCFLPKDRETGRPRGFAFVEYADPSSAGEAVTKFDGLELGGRNLRVNEADERRRGPGPGGPPSGARGPGGGYGGRGGGPGGGRGGGGGGALLVARHLRQVPR